MKKTLLSIVLLFCFASFTSAQLNDLKLKNSSKSSFLNLSSLEKNNTFQVKKRKTVNSYFGAGYSFMIFTSKYMQDAFPVLDTRTGSFLTNINLFFGFAVARAVTLEIEPTILFTSNEKTIDYALSQTHNGYNYAHAVTNNLLAFPIVFNARFFPFFKLASFARLFFIGGGVGAVWMREENDVFYNNNATFFNYFTDPYSTQSTNQWQPIFRAMTGFTGSGGQFGFGGELRYNFIPLTQDKSLPFATRFASNANSVDITLRFYFSL
ncbi:MAG TPA: hypothetical protein VGK25_05805 [Ignavibacteria bacterium]|jgi:hypothetical protein